jgi:hypothetical protein
MPVERNSQNIEDVTLNGNTVGKIEVNGTTVYTSRPAPVAEADLLLWYPFDDGTANDFSGTGANAAVFGPAYNPTGGPLENGAFSFDGTDDYMSLPFSFAQDNIGSFTVTALVNVPADGGDWAILDFDRSEYFTAATGVPDNDANGEGDKVIFATTDTSSVIDDMWSNGSIRSGTWRHVAWRFDNSANEKSIFIDGVFDTSKSVDSVGNGTTRFGFIGDGSEAGSENGDRNVLHFTGSTRDIRYYDTALTDAQIDSIYSNTGLFNPVDATGGTTVTTFTDSSGIEYQIHAFESVGTDTITVNNGGKVDVLVVGGGGGGGSSQSGNNAGCGGGGGAGGLVFVEGLSLSATNFSIDVGAPGSRQTPGGSVGNKGENSSFDTIEALGGGGGGAGDDSGSSGQDGGSGGGAGNDFGDGGSATQPGSSDGGFGNAGGNTPTSLGDMTAGGGGAGGVGESIPSSPENQDGGSGGPGLDFSDRFGTSFGENGFFAGGGGGGANTGGEGSGNGGIGGIGGGGDGGNDSSDGSDGMNQTGGGGGGAGDNGHSGGAGGSGIVLIRYPLDDPS